MRHVSPRSVTVVLLLALTLGATGARGQAPDSTFTLEGLLVTASPTPRPASAVAARVTVLQGSELRARGLWTLAEALAQVPGLAVVQGGSRGATTSLFMRGGESDYTQVLLDGVPLNQPGGSFDLAGLTLEGVERVEIVRGPMSSLYGSDAVSGVVNVITRTGTPGDAGVRGQASVRAGTEGRLDASVGVRGGTPRVTYGATLARYRGDGLLAFNNQHSNTVFTGTVRVAPDARTRADLTARLGDRVYHFPTDGGGVPVDRNAFTFGDETAVGLHLTRLLAQDFRLAARLAHHETDTGTDDRPDGPADTLGFYAFSSLDHVRRSSVDLSASVYRGGAVATLGADVESQRQRSFTQSASQFGPSSDRSSYRRSNRAVYAHVTRDGQSWSAQGGTRVEDNERYGAFVTWQAGLTLQADSETRLRLAAGRGIKEPTFFEAFATGFARGNPELDPEHSRSVEVGVDRSLASGSVVLRAGVYGQLFDDLIQYTSSPPTEASPNFFNVAEARAHGAEVSVTGSRGALSGSLSWSWVHTEVLDGGFDEGPDGEFAPGASLLRRPEHTLGFRAGWQGGRARAGVEVDVVGSRVDRDFSTFPARRVELPRYALVALETEVRVASRAGWMPETLVSLRVENLLDEAYEQVLGYAAPGRGFYLGVRVR